MKVLSLTWVHIRRLKKMAVVPNTYYNSNNSTHAWQVGPDPYCSLLLTALFHWGPTPSPFWEVLPTFRKVLSSLSAATCQSSLRTFIHAPRCVFHSHVPQYAQVKVHTEPPQPPYFHSWHPCMTISLSPEFPLSSRHRTVHHEFFLSFRHVFKYYSIQNFS